MLIWQQCHLEVGNVIATNMHPAVQYLHIRLNGYVKTSAPDRYMGIILTATLGHEFVRRKSQINQAPIARSI